MFGLKPFGTGAFLDVTIQQDGDGVGVAAGVGAAAAVGAALAAAIGVSAGNGAAAAVGASLAAAIGSASGVGAAVGVSVVLSSAVGAAAGVGAASGVGFRYWGLAVNWSGDATLEYVSTSTFIAMIEAGEVPLGIAAEIRLRSL